MDLIKNCIESIVEGQRVQVSMYEEGYKKGKLEGYAEGLRTAREEFEKSLLELEGKSS